MQNKVLITGGAGYIGSHTTLSFLQKGFDVVVFDNLECSSEKTVQTLKQNGNVEFILGDLRNYQDVQQVFENFKIQAVIHFAAFSLVGESVANPAKYYKNNILGTLNLLDAMMEAAVKNIVFSSTCATYGDPEYVPIDEKHPQNPINPYGQTKLFIEKIMTDYEIDGLKSIKLRYFNVAGADCKNRIGECHNPETHLIPNIIKSALGKGQIFNIFGDDYDTPDGTCIRDYVNVEDLAKAHLLAFEYLLKEQKSDVFNLGTQHGTSVKQVFAICEEVLNKKIPVKIMPRRAGDPAVLYADSKKAKRVLGWQPQNTIKESILTAYNWEKNKITKNNFI